MNPTELKALFEKETGEKWYATDAGITFFTAEYVEWLESRVTTAAPEAKPLPGEMLAFLKEYFKSTPPEQIKKEWDEIGDVGSNGLRISDILETLRGTPPKAEDALPDDYEIEKEAYLRKPLSKNLNDNTARNNWIFGAQWMRGKARAHAAKAVADCKADTKPLIVRAIAVVAEAELYDQTLLDDDPTLQADLRQWLTGDVGEKR